MAIVEEIVSNQYENEQQHKHCHGDRLVRLRRLHGSAILRKTLVCRFLLEQHGVDAVVISVKRPVMQGKCRHGTLIANIEYHVIIDVNAIAEPCNLGWFCFGVAISCHKYLALRLQLLVPKIEVLAHAVREL